MRERIVDLSINVKLTRDVIIRFLRSETRKVGFRKVVVGLSGGLDSSLVTLLCVEAMGKENVIPLFLPYSSSHPQSERDADLIAQRISLKSKKIDITPMIDAYFSQDQGDRIRRGNKMARERMSILFDQAMANRALVVGASNKSELLLGYSTWFGDMAASLLPIGDLYKTQVRQMGEELQLPSEIVNKAPSADLWEGQTDEEELGFSYELADQILYLYADERMGEDAIIKAGFAPDLVGKILKRVQRYQFKRRPPLICKLSPRTINWDFRYLRDWGR